MGKKGGVKRLQDKPGGAAQVAEFGEGSCARDDRHLDSRT